MVQVHTGFFQGIYNHRDQHQLHDDARNCRGNGSGDERGKGEGIPGNTGQEQADDTPYHAAGNHGDNQRGVYAGDRLRELPVQETGYAAVNRQFKCHGNGARKHGRHAEQHGPQQRRDKTDGQAPGPAAQEAAQQYRNMHRAEGGTDFRDLPGEEGKDDCQRQAQRCIGQSANLQGIGRGGVTHQGFSPSVSWRMRCIASDRMAAEPFTVPAT